MDLTLAYRHANWTKLRWIFRIDELGKDLLESCSITEFHYIGLKIFKSESYLKVTSWTHLNVFFHELRDGIEKNTCFLHKNDNDLEMTLKNDILKKIENDIFKRSSIRFISSISLSYARNDFRTATNKEDIQREDVFAKHPVYWLSNVNFQLF